MSFIKIGKEFINLNAVIKITQKEIIAKDKSLVDAALLHFANGETIPISKIDMENIFILTGEKKPPEINAIEKSRAGVSF